MSEEKVSEQPTASPDEVSDAVAVVAAGADEDANPISASDLSDNGDSESLHKQDLGFTEEELRRNLETIASTGKFWIEWDKLKSMLSFKLKQVLSEYNEGKMPVEEQNSALGETYLELMQRLDEALLAFDEGPPFTLQRLCEILLTAQSIYPKLRKLALALEKNLLVSSMLSTSYADPSLDPATNNNTVLEPELPKKDGEIEKSSNEENGVDNTVISGNTITTAAADTDTDTDKDDEPMVDVEIEEEAKDHQANEGISSMDTEEEAVVEEETSAAVVVDVDVAVDVDVDAPSSSSESEMKSTPEPTE